jgi:Fe2+ transport system protein FeoA
MKKTLNNIFALGNYTIVKIHCTYDDAEKLERLGIFEGEQITLIKNDKRDASIVIENMDANFVLDKEIAKGIEIAI